MTTLDPQEMTRLAFTRLLFQQAMQQSNQPAPLSAGSILTFHDVAEQFLILAAEHLKAGAVSKDKNLTQYWPLLRSHRGFAGVELSGQHAIARLTSVRNDLKHLGRLPSGDEIADARAGVTGLLEDNTPKVFGIELAAIDMADVVPQQQARARLKDAATAEAAGDRKEAMAQLSEAFEEMFGSNLQYGSRYAFGQTMSRIVHPLSVSSMVNTLSRGLPQPQDRRSATGAGQNLDRQLKQLTDVVASMQQGMRVVALGIDFGQYNRFEQLTPRIHGSGEHRHVIVDSLYAPTREEYDDCRQFVIAVALRMAQLEAQTARPSWRPI